jgi:hypothetical protein
VFTNLQKHNTDRLFMSWVGRIRVTTSIGYHSTSQKLSFYEAQDLAEDSSYLDVPDQKLTIMTC